MGYTYIGIECLHVYCYSTSDDISPQQNAVTLNAKVVRIAELEIRGSSEPDQVFYGGEVKGESAMV